VWEVREEKVVGKTHNLYLNTNTTFFNPPKILLFMLLCTIIGGVSVITEKGDITTSYLLIQRARPSDSGKYSLLSPCAGINF
jgi:hypothetical protein